MMDNSHNHPAENRPPEQIGPPRTLKILIGVIFAIGGGYYLWTQHRAHTLQYWPFAIFLLCPLMHFFGHKGHGGHKGPDHRSGRQGEGHHD